MIYEFHAHFETNACVQAVFNRVKKTAIYPIGVIENKPVSPFIVAIWRVKKLKDNGKSD